MAKFKSSIRNITLKDFVSMPFKFFSAAGIKVFQWNDSDILTTKEKILFAANCINLVINFISLFGSAILDETVDTLTLTQWILYLSYAMNGFCKTFFVILGRKTLSRILKALENIFPRTSKERHDFNLAEGFDFVIRHTKFMYLSHFAMTFIFDVFPLVQSSVEYFRTKVYTVRLPYLSNYPFNIVHGLGFVAAYISQFLAGCTIVCHFVASDILLVCTIYVVILQFKHLCSRIENFKPKNYAEDMRELKDILKRHELLNDLAEDVNNVFRVSILLNYMMTITLIVLIALQISFGTELLDFVKFIISLIACVIEMYYICMFGDQLSENSALVGVKFAGQKWYMADLRYQRMLTLAIARSQNPAHLTAYKFFIISKESFSNLMTTSYQFFTLLKTRIEEKNN